MPTGRVNHPRAPLTGALFCALLLTAAGTPAAPACAPRGDTFQARVRHVYDGDTVLTRYGQRIRLIGINTPETGKRRRPAQPLANEARARLLTLLRQARMRVTVMPGLQRRDRYGRLLAHLFLPDGRNLQRLMLDEGLAFRIAVHPNLRLQDCYTETERKAREAKRGIWGHPYFRVWRADALHRHARGFRIVRGRVRGISQRRGRLDIRLEGRLMLRIPRRSVKYFETDPRYRRLRGREVEARGWLIPTRYGPLMNITHPNDLRVIDARP